MLRGAQILLGVKNNRRQILFDDIFVEITKTWDEGLGEDLEEESITTSGIFKSRKRRYNRRRGVWITQKWSWTFSLETVSPMTNNGDQDGLIKITLFSNNGAIVGVSTIDLKDRLILIEE